MNKWKICTWISISLSYISSSLMFISISYTWGYSQSMIDNHIAYFSSPAYLNILNGLPFLLSTIIFCLLSFYFHKKSAP